MISEYNRRIRKKSVKQIFLLFWLILQIIFTLFICFITSVILLRNIHLRHLYLLRPWEEKLHPW